MREEDEGLEMEEEEDLPEIESVGVDGEVEEAEEEETEGTTWDWREMEGVFMRVAARSMSRARRLGILAVQR